MRVNLRVNSKAFCQLIISMTAAKVQFFVDLSKFFSKMSVRFFLDKTRIKKHGDGAVNVRCAICIKGKRLTTTAGFSILPELWDQENQKVRLSTPNGKSVVIDGQTARDLNSRLKKIDSYFSDYEAELKRKNDPVGDLKELFGKEFGKKSPDILVEEETEAPDIRDYLKAFLEEQSDKNKWRTLTVRSMDSFKSHMEDFFDHDKITSIDYFDEDGTTRFVNFLIDDKCLRNSTIEKYTSRLRYFIRWAGKKGYTSLKADYKPRLQKTKKPIVFLDWNDLIKLLNYEFPEIGTEIELEDVHGNQYKKKVSIEKDTAERIRDAFCFCCFTSLRYSDLKRLQRTNIFGKYILLTTKKDTDSVKIELNKYSKAILDKYRDESFPFNAPLPVISEQRMNEHLKLIGEMCGFNDPVHITYFRGSERVDEVYEKWKLMTTHVGRKTFICNSLMLGIAPQIVMKWTGHSDYAAMKPYIEIADKAKEDAMSLFDAK